MKAYTNGSIPRQCFLIQTASSASEVFKNQSFKSKLFSSSQKKNPQIDINWPIDTYIPSLYYKIVVNCSDHVHPNIQLRGVDTFCILFSGPLFEILWRISSFFSSCSLVLQFTGLFLRTTKALSIGCIFIFYFFHKKSKHIKCSLSWTIVTNTATW